MLNMSNSSKEFLKKYLPDLLKQDDLDRVLLDLDAFITRECLNENDDMTDLGHKAQSVYDDLYFNNDG